MHKCKGCERQIADHITHCLFCVNRLNKMGLCGMCGVNPRKPKISATQSKYCESCQDIAVSFANKRNPCPDRHFRTLSDKLDRKNK